MLDSGNSSNTSTGVRWLPEDTKDASTFWGHSKPVCHVWALPLRNPKKIKNNMKINLYEKSYHKCIFLKEVSRKLNLNTEIIHKDIFTVKNIETGTIMSRAFKPMPIILNLVYENFKKYKNIIFFMGNSERKILNDTLQDWNLNYEEKKSLTNEDSFILNIKKIEKKISWK